MFVTEREKLRNDVETLAVAYNGRRSGLLPILQAVQENYGHISDYAMQVIADELNLHPVEIYSVVTFYAFLTQRPQGKFVIRLCRTVSCDTAGKNRVARQLENDLGIGFGETTPDGKFTLAWANCLGMCDQGPALLVNDYIFTRVTPERVHEILEICRQAFGVYATEGKSGIFRRARHRPITSLTGPLSLSGVGTNGTLKRVLSLPRPDIISELKDSGLRGRGGAGFPTYVKWNLAASAKGDTKYVICNADEGEPGTFKDRVLLTDYADLVVEGMTIGAYAIGAQKGYVYLRGEYAYLREHLEQVLERRRRDGFLGQNVAGKEGLSFDIEVFMGSGAYVCGEETALIESMEGFRGEPRNRPPFPVDAGYFGLPTIVNNVETFAWAATIMEKGGKWFSETYGTQKSPGLKLFSVSGDCERPGVYEFPMGITVAKLLQEVGGENAKAVQVGGASGCCVPAKDFHRTIAYEDIPTGGSVIVFGPDRDMLQVAKNFLEFFVEESCGQCTPCRIGNVRLFEGVKMLEEGRCSMNYLNELCQLGETMRVASKCGLGQSSPNAFLTIVEHFKDEILGRTPAVA